MDKDIKRVLFLTSTVSPGNNPHIGSPAQRREEYLASIKFYLENTNLPLVIVDNSGYDFRNDFPDENRLEAFCYIAPVNDKGKGYDEMGILEYGLENSKYLAPCNQIVKISGRYLFRNINRILRRCTDAGAVYAEWNIVFTDVETWLLIGPASFYRRIIERKDCLSDKDNYLVERLAAEVIKEWAKEGQHCHTILIPTDIVGHPGSSVKPYTKPTLLKYIKMVVKFVVNELRLLRLRLIG